MKVKSASALVKVSDAAVPDPSARHAEKRPKFLPVDREVSFDPSHSKHRKEIRVLERSYGRQLEFEKSGLVGIQIDAVDSLRAVQQVVQRIAAGAGDHDDPIFLADIQSPLINNGVFPALVVDEVSPVNLVEQPLVHSASIANIITLP